MRDTLSYTVEHSPRGLMLSFNHAPPESARIELYRLGYQFSCKYKCWIGKRNFEKAIETAERAVKNGELWHIRTNGTLCWDCGKALGGCSWSKSFIPVSGWTADKTDLHIGYADDRRTVKTCESFFVYKCPEFEPEKRKKVNPVESVPCETTSDPA